MDKFPPNGTELGKSVYLLRGYIIFAIRRQLLPNLQPFECAHVLFFRELSHNLEAEFLLRLQLMSSAIKNVFYWQHSLAVICEVIEVGLIVFQIEVTIFFQSFLGNQDLLSCLTGCIESLNRFASLFYVVQSYIEFFVH